MKALGSSLVPKFFLVILPSVPDGIFVCHLCLLSWLQLIYISICPFFRFALHFPSCQTFSCINRPTNRGGRDSFPFSLSNWPGSRSHSPAGQGAVTLLLLPGCTSPVLSLQIWNTLKSLSCISRLLFITCSSVVREHVPFPNTGFLRLLIKQFVIILWEFHFLRGGLRLGKLPSYRKLFCQSYAWIYLVSRHLKYMITPSQIPGAIRLCIISTQTCISKQKS